MGPSAQDLNSYWPTGEMEENWAQRRESPAAGKSVIGWATPSGKGDLRGHGLKQTSTQTVGGNDCVLYTAASYSISEQSSSCAFTRNWTFLSTVEQCRPRVLHLTEETAKPFYCINNLDVELWKQHCRKPVLFLTLFLFSFASTIIMIFIGHFTWGCFNIK